jgi:uncharacterized integral membrane protein (TIGR00698 family)
MSLKSGCFWLSAAAMLLPVFSPPIALALGVVFALTLGNPAPEQLQRLGSMLLKVCVVGLGFGLPLDSVVDMGLPGLLVSGAVVIGVLLTGAGLARLLRLDQPPARLISVGTAICGGSAIAAVAPVIGASHTSLSVALASIFVLNAAALYLFPIIAHSLELTQSQFAFWAALAIHDTSSVVGAAASYGDQALAEATVLKLARAIWIVPLVVALWIMRRSEWTAKGPVAWPLFIGLFVLASAARSALPSLELAFDSVAWLAQRGLVLVLFVIGSSMTRELLRQIGWRPLSFALVLWILVSSLTLGAVILWPSVVP